MIKHDTNLILVSIPTFSGLEGWSRKKAAHTVVSRCKLASILTFSG